MTICDVCCTNAASCKLRLDAPCEIAIGQISRRDSVDICLACWNALIDRKQSIISQLAHPSASEDLLKVTAS